jgi:predicted GNAT superfamily acetyltransferase
MLIRDANVDDFAQILGLNEESVHFLSPLSLLRLQSLHAEADYHRVLEIDNEIVGFLLAFREGSQYDSTNYLWFLNQYDKFLYIDRVVISKQHQGRGNGNKLYDDIFVYGRSSDATRITCEFDIDPPNEASRRFHQRYGFEEVGTRSYGNVSKQVSLQAVAL